MNEAMKQNRLLKEQGDDRSFSYSSNDRNIGSDHQENVRNFILVSVGCINALHHPLLRFGSWSRNCNRL